FMAPDTWKGLYTNTLMQVQSGAIPMARLDEAVTRILCVKLRAGLFEEGPPSQRPYGGKWEELGSAEHRAVARQAVRESLVLLKNEAVALPLQTNLKVLLAGDGADNMSEQTGGWTLSWQGDGNTRAESPNAQSICDGSSHQVSAAGGRASLSVAAALNVTPDV